ncbi:MAG: helix-turn-helix domain-containing protein [Bacillota bacterium]|jgi:excisionase family DNA binding protein
MMEQRDTRGLLLTIPEMAKILRISRNHAYALAHRKDGPPVLCLGRALRVPTVGLERWIEAEAEKRVLK